MTLTLFRKGVRLTWTGTIFELPQHDGKPIHYEDKMPAQNTSSSRFPTACVAAQYTRITIAAILALFVLAHAPDTAAQGSSVDAPQAGGYAGVWIDDTGDGAIEIAPCGGRLCGHIVWLKQPVDRQGKPLRDAYNPDPQRRARPICGLRVIGDLARQRNGSWDNGWIYDPTEGKTYDVELKLKSAGELLVTGYLGVKLLSETFVWKRAPDGLQRCAA